MKERSRQVEQLLTDKDELIAEKERNFVQLSQSLDEHKTSLEKKNTEQDEQRKKYQHVLVVNEAPSLFSLLI